MPKSAIFTKLPCARMFNPGKLREQARILSRFPATRIYNSRQLNPQAAPRQNTYGAAVE